MDTKDDYEALTNTTTKQWPLVIKWMTQRKEFRAKTNKKIQEVKMYASIEKKLQEILNLQVQKLTYLEALQNQTHE